MLMLCLIIIDHVKVLFRVNLYNKKYIINKFMTYVLIKKKKDKIKSFDCQTIIIQYSIIYKILYLIII